MLPYIMYLFSLLFPESHIHQWMLTLTASHLILGYGVPMILKSILYEIYV